MAGIDKTYTSSWLEYQALVDWARKTVFICPDGTKLRPIDYIYRYWKEENFNGNEIPVMNTSNVCDYFLIKYCPLGFVQERMSEVYSAEYIQSIKDGVSAFDTFSKEGKYGIKYRLIKQPKKPNRCNRTLGYWFVQLLSPFIHYCEAENRWIWPDELTETRGWVSNTCHKFKTRRAIERHIRKWKLPKGTIVEVSGGYVGEEYEYLIY